MSRSKELKREAVRIADKEVPGALTLDEYDNSYHATQLRKEWSAVHAREIARLFHKPQRGPVENGGKK